MSWTPEAIVIRGYKIPSNIWYEFSKNPSKDEEYYEDYLIDTNPITGEGELFFGIIIYSVTEDTPFKEIDQIIEGDMEYQMKLKFHILFDKIYDKMNMKKPKCKTYIGSRYI